ncbi:MAG: hypothetical protein IJ576_05230 [Synergistaceae bacterium]|nr:hypothetical protein [Synergistaceae bacterium]MBR1602700.1 hypothetical protein [Synergistaceae bacterium]
MHHGASIAIADAAARAMVCCIAAAAAQAAGRISSAGLSAPPMDLFAAANGTASRSHYLRRTY